MQVKRFRQPTVKQALRAVRQELGPQALVLATEVVAAGGWRGWFGMREVQLTAGVTPSLSGGRQAANEGRSTDTRLRENASAGQASTPKDALVARLMASGLDRTLADAVAAGVPASSHRGATLKELQLALASHLTDLAQPTDTFQRVEVFIGPPGVGKTTTIAKIAAQERARKGRPLGLVGADGFRAGAVEQLRTYASIIGAPFRVARTIEDLEAAMTSGRHSLLVDTAGRSPQDGGLRDLRRLLGSRRGIRTHLVLAGDTSANSARRILDAYYDARPDRVVISKVDEAESLSPLLSVLRERALPVSYITTGQRVPEDLESATPAVLAGVVLRDAVTHRGWTAAAVN
jgi:flagellar biosynthesis protein FlhF